VSFRAGLVLYLLLFSEQNKLCLQYRKKPKGYQLLMIDSDRGYLGLYNLGESEATQPHRAFTPLHIPTIHTTTRDSGPSFFVYATKLTVS